MALLILGTLGKAIIKGGLSASSFFLEFDASLSALYAGIVYLFDVARNPALQNETKLELTAGFIIVALIFFFGVVLLHQICEKEDKKDRLMFQFLTLGILGNVLGFTLLVAFILLVKGV